MKRRFAAILLASVLPCVHIHAAQDTVTAMKDDNQWVIPAKDYASTRFSGLDQVNAGNARQLQVARTFPTGLVHGHEAARLVQNDTMYIVTPYPNYLYAIDMKEGGGALKWVYKLNPARALQGVACCDEVNRGAAYADGGIIFNTLDHCTVAVDAESGKEAWKTRLGDINPGETMTMAPLAVKDKVLVGNSGGEMGVRGWLTALDMESGKQAWRAYTAGPDPDVLIGPDFKPPYPQDKGKDLDALPAQSIWKLVTCVRALSRSAKEPVSQPPEALQAGKP